MLEEVGLVSTSQAPPGELSGGERQRVAVARLSFDEPAVMLMDKPTAHLDTDAPAGAGAPCSHIHGRAMTCIMVTHDEHMTAQADQTLRLVDGKVVGNGARKVDEAGVQHS